MKLTDARDLAIKVFGLYCLVNVVLFAPQLASVYFMPESMTQHLTSKVAYEILMCLPLFLNLGFAYAFLIRTELVISLIWGKQPIDEATLQNPPATISLSFWITLIGVYYFIESLAGLLTELWILASSREIWGAYPAIKFLPNVIILPCSIFCMLRAKSIEEFIQRKARARSSAGENPR